MNDLITVKKDDIIKTLQSKIVEIEPVRIEKAVDTLLSELTAALLSDDRVEIRGFGSLNLKMREAGLVRNPRTGDYTQKEQRRYVFFRASRELIKRLNFVGCNDN
jgi:integration host factor subunit beta